MRRAEKYVSAVVLAAFLVANNARAYYVSGQLSPENFNKMYALASHGEVASLREAVNRGLNIDSLNSEGDTGLCIAVKRGNRVAYNSFRMAGANPHHACTYRMYDEYRRFLASNQVASTRKVVGDAASLYYEEQGRSWWPWILGGALVGGGIWALTKKSGGGSKHHSGGNGGSGGDDNPVLPETLGYGLAHYLDNYTRLVSNNVENANIIDGRNPDAEKVVDSIKFLPNMLDNYKYLKTYAKVVDGGSFHNLAGGNIQLGDASVGLASHGDGSTIMNDGSIDIEGRNGAIGMVASNGSQAINGADTGVSGDQSSDGSIRFIFKGSQEGDAAIGMYGDTRSTIVNYGKITGVASQAEAHEDDSSSSSNVYDEVGNLVEDLGDEDLTNQAANSGTMIGMSLFDFYTGTDFSNSTITAKNYGNIVLQAGNNNASDVSISLIGMGSYLDDKFLNGKNNPAFAENMLLQNYGNINLSYQKVYNLSSDALKLGTGGLIGMRADASTVALNQGNINIDMQATNISSGSDVAAGMLSVHGAGLVNGTAGMAYNGEGSDTGGTIRVINEATSGGVFYGMLAAKGSGSQTSLYKWQKPFLHNYGLIDMQSSNSYAMASFAGGEMVNDGVINLGVENGHSYYTNNKGMYAAGEDITEVVSLINNGIINVYAQQSAAIYNVFSGSVTQTNTGYIYVSNKATNSKVFGGNYSTAINSGDILYKVGNSESFVFPTGRLSDPGLLVKTSPAVSVVTASSEGASTKQYAVNDETGIMTIGGPRDKNVDYGGTFGTAGIQVSKQGSADNKGVISLEMFDRDISQFNVGMWLDSTTTSEAYINNYGDINVRSVGSVGMRNDSKGASATNFGTIDVLGGYGYGMAVTNSGGNIFNGRYLSNSDENKTINVIGDGSIGMYIKGGGNAYNYGLINLLGNNTTAFQLDGEDSNILVEGDIARAEGLDGVTYFWMVNKASKTFNYPEGVVIDGYTLGKATHQGKAYLSASSTAYVSGNKAHLFVAENNGSGVYNYGTVEVSNGNTAIIAKDGATAYNDMRDAKITVKDDLSVGILGEGSGTTVGSTPGSNIYVEAGQGIHARGLAKIENGGNVTVTDGIGLYMTDGGNEYTQGINSGKISVEGDTSIGAVVVNGAHFTNEGNIVTSGETKGIYTNSVVENASSGMIIVNDESIGIHNTGNDNDVVNSGNISVYGASAYGIYGGGVNSGKIDVYNGTGVKGRINNSGEIVVYHGIGVDGTVDNSGVIDVKDGVGVLGGGSNSGTISTSGEAAVKVSDRFINSGQITGNGVGVEVVSGTFINQNSISLGNGRAVQVDAGGNADNMGEISVNNGYGFYVKDSGHGTNYGIINIASSGYGAYVEDGGSFSNVGTINYSSKKNGHCANIGVGGECIDADAENPEGNSITAAIKVEDGGKFINSGDVNLEGVDVDFSEGGEYVLADGGTYRASSFKGNVTASSDIVMDGFEDTYAKQNAFEGKNEGLSVKSDSYMFDARLEDKEDATDVYMERKDFKDIVDEEDLAAFLEDNYHQQGNEKMYRALKSASNRAEFDAQTESESGQRFYANLPKENMVVLRQLSGKTQKRVLEDGVDGIGVGADYYRTGKDGIDRLSGYDDNVYSVYASAGGKLNRYWSVGGSLMAAYDDSQYSDIHSKRDNKIFMALLPIMYHNNQFKWVTTPEFGVGYGSYVRKTLNNKYEADTFDVYYGVYNAAEYSIDMKVAELVTEAELNLQAIDSDKVKEKGGFYLNNHNTTSLEAGIGLKLRKRIQLAKERELILALGSKYYHEFLDPYEDLTIGSGATSKTYRLKGYSENKNRLKTTAEATYKDGPLAISAEISHNAEKESNVEGDIGLRYHF